jgi:hypothetical protein
MGREEQPIGFTLEWYRRENLASRANLKSIYSSWRGD